MSRELKLGDDSHEKARKAGDCCDNEVQKFWCPKPLDSAVLKYSAHQETNPTHETGFGQLC